MDCTDVGTCAAAWVTAVATCCLVIGAVYAVRAYTMDQVVRFGREIVDAKYYGRFWHVEMRFRSHVVVRRPGHGVWRTHMENDGVLPARKAPGQDVEGIVGSAKDGKLWAALLLDMLGPGYSSDGARADMIDFRALMSRVAFWAGIGRKRRKYQQRRVRALVRVLGPQFVDVVYRHRLLATRMIYLKVADQTDDSSPLFVDFRYYPEAYGVLDEHYQTLATRIAEVAQEDEFGSTMSATAAALAKLEQAVKVADWSTRVPNVATTP